MTHTGNVLAALFVLAALALIIFVGREFYKRSRSKAAQVAAGALVPPDLIEKPWPLIKDLPIGGSTYTYFGYHVATDNSLWIDPEDLQEERPVLGQTNRVRITRQADGYHVHILGAVKGQQQCTPEWMARVGYVRAVEVTH